jgi:RimJ/RimL family protein N-acetyltransferase
LLDINNIAHGVRLAELLGIPYVPNMHTVLSRIGTDGELMGGFIYTDYTGPSITIHMHGITPGWMNRAIMWVLFDYPFMQLGVKKILAPISSGNEVTLGIASRLGFQEVARVPDVYKDGDLILMATTPDQCRWLRRPASIREAA